MPLFLPPLSSIVFRFIEASLTMCHRKLTRCHRYHDVRRTIGRTACADDRFRIGENCPVVHEMHHRDLCTGRRATMRRRREVFDGQGRRISKIRKEHFAQRHRRSLYNSTCRRQHFEYAYVTLSQISLDNVRMVRQIFRGQWSDGLKHRFRSGLSCFTFSRLRFSDDSCPMASYQSIGRYGMRQILCHRVICAPVTEQ